MDQPLKFKIMPKENDSEAFHSLNFVHWAWYSNATIDFFGLGLFRKAKCRDHRKHASLKRPVFALFGEDLSCCSLLH